MSTAHTLPVNVLRYMDKDRDNNNALHFPPVLSQCTYMCFGAMFFWREAWILSKQTLILLGSAKLPNQALRCGME